MLGHKKTTLYILDGSLELFMLILQQVGIIKALQLQQFQVFRLTHQQK